MHKATVCGRHGFHLHWLPGADRALCHTFSEHADLLLTAITILLDVHDDGASVVFTTAKDDVRDVLKRT